MSTRTSLQSASELGSEEMHSALVMRAPHDRDHPVEDYDYQEDAKECEPRFGYTKGGNHCRQHYVPASQQRGSAATIFLGHPKI